MDRSTEILEAVEGLLGASEFEVVDVACVGDSGGYTVRIFLDKPGGLSIDDCARVSRAVGDHFEAEETFAGRYRLEVSSPGIDRPLRKAVDFDRFAGETVQIATYENIEGSRKHRGVLKGYESETDSVLMEGEGEEILRIPRGAIRKAHLQRDPWEGVRGKKRKQKKRERRRPRSERSSTGRPEKGNA